MAVASARTLGIGAIVLVGTFLLGYVPAEIGARSARAEQARLTHKLELTALEVQLGMMSLEANRDNYGLAAKLATPFFDGLQTAIASQAGQDVTRALQVMLVRRDEITSDLAQAKPGVKEKISGLYGDLYRLMQASPDTAPPQASR